MATEVVFDVKRFTGSGSFTFFLSDGNVKGKSQNLKIYSSFIAMEVSF